MFLSLPDNHWGRLLEQESCKPYFTKLCDFLDSQYSTETVFPPKEQIFEALCLTDFDGVKVAILGQDPYHGLGQAHGLAFSVLDGRVPPSLKNIYRELSNDVSFEIPEHGNLSSWCNQGVLLLNTVLTVRQGEPNSHRSQGWELFTDEVIRLLSAKQDPIVFMLWGRNAISKKNLITSSHHLVLTASHPSPLSSSNGFFGCKHFSKTDIFLNSPINWQL